MIKPESVIEFYTTTELLEIFKKYREKIGERIGMIAIRGAAVIMLGSGIFLLTQAGK